MEKFFGQSYLSKFCHSCQSNSQFSDVRKLSSCGSHVIFQFLRFSECNGQFVKNSDHVVCDSIISFPVVNPDGSLSPKKFVLKALINHVGTIVNGHYTAILKDRNEDCRIVMIAL